LQQRIFSHDAHKFSGNQMSNTMDNNDVSRRLITHSQPKEFKISFEASNEKVSKPVLDNDQSKEINADLKSVQQKIDITKNITLNSGRSVDESQPEIQTKFSNEDEKKMMIDVKNSHKDDLSQQVCKTNSPTVQKKQVNINEDVVD
jgi:hypothetical protein